MKTEEKLKTRLNRDYHNFLYLNVMQDQNGDIIQQSTALMCKECNQVYEFNIDFYESFKNEFLCWNCWIKYNLPETIDHLFHHPKHYQSNCGLEVIDVIKAFKLDFCLGNAVKYILRYGKKDDCELEIRKAIWYLERFLQDMNVTEKK